MKYKLNLHEILKTVQVLETKNIWNLDELKELLGVTEDQLIYIFSIITDIYTIDGDLFIDYELDTKKNVLKFEFSKEASYINILNDVELLNLYILMSVDKDYKNLIIENSNVKEFFAVLKKYYKQFDIQNIEVLNIQDLNFDNVTYIEYVKQGSTDVYTYKIKPQVLKTNNDGVILVAYDVTDKREKTFLVNRIVKIYEQFESDLKEIQKTQDYILEFKTTNKNVLNYLESNNNLGNDEIYKFKFYSKNNALEFCIKFIKDIQVISPRDIIDEILKRKLELLESLNYESN
jgi:hypothetical protein